MELKDALNAVVKECPDGYAQTYAKAALELGECEHHFIASSSGEVVISHVPTGKMMIGEELKVQLLYVLSNLQYWRGERAREVKAVLKQYSK